ncbi:MAG: ABC transporter permease [Acidobacteriota bacterium]
MLLILSITTERERGTLEQLLVTELRPDAILAGKCLAIGIVGLLECLLLAAFMRFLFHLEIQSGVVLFLAVLPLFVLGPLGLGLFIAALARNQVQALQFAQVVFLPSVMLSGFLFPREFLNSPFAVVSNLLPTSYLVSLSRSLILRGASFREAGPDILASAVFTIVLAAAGWWTMRRSFAR